MGRIDPSFGVDAFNRAKYKNETETIATAILNLLFAKPGYFPSMPDLGINIQNILYSFWDEIDPTVIKAQIITQCQEFKQYVDDGSLDVIKSSYNEQPLLIVVIPVQVKNTKRRLVIGVTVGENGEIKYNYDYDSSED